MPQHIVCLMQLENKYQDVHVVFSCILQYTSRHASLFVLRHIPLPREDFALTEL